MNSKVKNMTSYPTEIYEARFSLYSEADLYIPKLQNAIKTENIEAICICLSEQNKTLDINYQQQESDQTFLIMAINTGNIEIVRLLLEYPGINVDQGTYLNITGTAGTSPLLYAYLKIFKINKDRLPPFDIDINNAQFNIFKLLLPASSAYSKSLVLHCMICSQNYDALSRNTVYKDILDLLLSYEGLHSVYDKYMGDTSDVAMVRKDRRILEYLKVSLKIPSFNKYLKDRNAICELFVNEDIKWEISSILKKWYIYVKETLFSFNVSKIPTLDTEHIQYKITTSAIKSDTGYSKASPSVIYIFWVLEDGQITKIESELCDSDNLSEITEKNEIYISS